MTTAISPHGHTPVTDVQYAGEILRAMLIGTRGGAGMNMVVTNLNRIDAAFFLWLVSLRRGGYPWISRLLSRSGDGPLYAVVALLTIALDPQAGLQIARVGLAAFAVELPLYLLLKRAIRRDRPQVAIKARAWLEPSDEFSFPSGHTAAAFLMAFVLSSAYPALTLPLYGWAVLVGISRVNLGVHYPGDIIAGALLGTAAALFAASILA